MEFANKEYFLLLLLILPYVLWLILSAKNTTPAIRVSTAEPYRNLGTSWKVRLMPIIPLLTIAFFVLVVIALARPQSTNSWKNKTVEGIDVMLAIDVSTSMLAEDLKPNRIDAAKEVAAEFIAGRPNDNIGLTIFAGEAFTQCPLTVDHASLLNLLHGVRTDISARGIIQDGTAIGMGLAIALSRLKDSKAKSKVVILLTDGSNNMGDISPLYAAELAKTLGIRVYTIGVGSKGTARYPMTVGSHTQYIDVKVDIDEKTLTQMAATADGHYYRATNKRELQKIYEEIDKLEKSKITTTQHRKHEDVFQPFCLAAVLVLLTIILLKLTIFRRIP